LRSGRFLGLPTLGGSNAGRATGTFPYDPGWSRRGRPVCRTLAVHRVPARSFGTTSPGGRELASAERDPYPAVPCNDDASEPGPHSRASQVDAQRKDDKRNLRRLLRRNPYWVAVAVVVLATAVATAVVWWLHARRFESTAFIDTHVVTISGQLGASIIDVPVTDNQLVKAGTVLVMS
jgi:hypothetical protein